MSKVSIPRISDNYLIEVFIDEILRNHWSLGLSASANVVIRVANSAITIKCSDFDGSDFSESKLITQLRSGDASSSIQTVHFRDQGLDPHCGFIYRRSETSLVDTVEYNNGGNNASSEESMLLQSKIHNLLVRGVTAIQSDKGVDSDSVFSAHHEVLTKLEGFNLNLVEKQHEHYQKLEQEKSDFIDEQNAEFKARRYEQESRLKYQRESLDKEYQAKDEALKQREQAVEDADNTTARRKTTVSALEAVKAKAERFEFSLSVRKNLVIIGWITGALAVFGFYNSFSAISILNSSPSPEANLFQLGRAAFGSLLGVSSIIYLLKWLNSWTNKVANQELDNQKYVRDLNRAHLTIEMCLEWNEKKDGPIPERLLEAMTDGVFHEASQPNTGEVNHPVDQLASALVKSAEKVEFPLGNGQITTTGKAINKLKPTRAVKQTDNTAA